MDKFVKQQFKMIIDFVQAAEKSLMERKKTHDIEQLPIGEFLDTFNACLNSASILYYSIELMKKMDEHEQKTKNGKIKTETEVKTEMSVYA